MIQYTGGTENEMVKVDRDIMVLANPEIAGLPNWVIALVAAGGLAAALSTAAGLLLAISSSISRDLLKGVFRPDISEKEELMASRIAMAVGGIEPVAEIINAVDKATETRILASIEETNPDLAEQIRELMFTFEDMALIDSKQMQVVMKDVDQADMVLALKTASDAVKDLIFSSMSTRAARSTRSARSTR